LEEESHDETHPPQAPEVGPQDGERAAPLLLVAVLADSG
jgi:hypothetical protein